MNGNDGEFAIGYGKPPINKRFQKGKSGNPNGRPRGTSNMTAILNRTLREKVSITENGGRKVITKLEAAMKQITNKAAGGDLAALRLLAALVRSADEIEWARASLDVTKSCAEAGYKDAEMRRRIALNSPEENDRRIDELLAKAGKRLVPIDLNGGGVSVGNRTIGETTNDLR
jgi:Family of unknown function (DUF5681)